MTNTTKGDVKKEGNKIEGHVYDGIEELDNSLPKWWLNLFYLTILFSIAYCLYYFIFNGPTLNGEYDVDKNQHQGILLAAGSKEKSYSEDELRAMVKDQGRLKQGSEVYLAKCLACHGPQGQGSVGPNLTDNYWIHGGLMTEMKKVVSEGVLDKGMPPWKGVLSEDELLSVLAFAKSLHGTNPSNPKAPQGNLVKE